jgi:hypothetical protein
MQARKNSSHGDKIAFPEVKPQRHRRGFGDADAGSGDYRAAGVEELFAFRAFGDEQRGMRGAQINTIEPAVNAQRLAQFRGAVGQVARYCDRPFLLHEHFAMHRLKCPDQHRFRYAGGTAHGIDAEVITVNQVHVAVAGRAEHDSISGSWSRRPVTGRVVAEVGFRFDDDAGAWSVGGVAHQPMAEQRRGNYFRRGFIE